VTLVLDTSLFRVDELVGLIASELAHCPARCGKTKVLAVDGGAGAGKSTLAALLGAAIADSTVLRTDSFLEGWHDQFTFWPRMRAVLADIAAGRPGRYDSFDSVLEAPAGPADVPVTGVLIVEGVSSIAACAGRISLSVFCDLPRAERERRWAQRDGMPVQPLWRRWLDAEDEFFAAHPPDADIVVRTVRG
jgi:energy-coupling factor transporter ATP-binding protein EcfA2